MKFYKLRHKATGLFWKPSKHRGKANLSKVGKIYSKKPTFKWCSSIYTPDAVKASSYNPKSTITQPGDWEVVEYSIVESNVVPLSL